MNTNLILQIITAALQLAPLAVSTVQGIRNLLSKDPNVPAELASILAQTATDNAAALDAARAWLLLHPEV